MRTFRENENKILNFEPYFNDYVITATICHNSKEIKPSHGYFYPHKYGKINKLVAKKLGYTFNNK